MVSAIVMPLSVSGASIQLPTDQFFVGTSPSIIFNSMLAAVPKALRALQKMFSSICVRSTPQKSLNPSGSAYSGLRAPLAATALMFFEAITVPIPARPKWCP